MANVYRFEDFDAAWAVLCDEPEESHEPMVG